MAKEKLLQAACDCDEVHWSAAHHSIKEMRQTYGEVCPACGQKIEITIIEVEKEVDPNPINFGKLGGMI